MAEKQKVLVATYQPMFETLRGHEMRVRGYMDVLRGDAEPAIGEEALLFELRGAFPEGTEFSEHSDLFATTTFLDMLEIGKGEYDSVVMVNNLAQYATGLGSTLAMTGIGADAHALVGKSIGNGLLKLREAGVPIYVTEWIGYGGYSPLGKIAFGEGDIGKAPEEAYRKILGDAGFSVENVSRFDFSDGAFERNDKSGEYILIKAVPASK